MKTLIFGSVASLLLATGAMAQDNRAETMTNQTVITLVNAGLGADTVVAKINASIGQYDTSTDALIALKQANVPDSVIAAMVGRNASPVAKATVADNSSPDPLVPHAPGVYLLDEANSKMVRIDATTSNQTKTAGIWGYALTSGIAKMKIKAVIPNAKARVKATAKPTFYFYFNTDSAMASMSQFGSTIGVMAASPNEFSLVKLDQKNDRREASVGSMNIGGVKAGISDKARTGFSYEDVAPGVFKVTPSDTLPPGEYGFMMSSGSGKDVISKIFDFSIS